MKEKYLKKHLENYSPQEKISLIGEPTKITNTILKKINPLYKGENEDEQEFFKKIQLDQLSFDFNPISKNKSLKNKIKNFLQKCVISSNNPYKSVWDFILLILICYNTMIICY